MTTATTIETAQPAAVDASVDLVEHYFQQGWTDGLPVVPPTRAKVDAVVATLGGQPDTVECKVPAAVGCPDARGLGH